MTAIRERQYIKCPFNKAPSFLNNYIERLSRSIDPDGSILRLEVPLAALGIPSGLNIGHDVVAHFAAPDDSYGVQRIAVTWKPEGGGAFPTLTGFISVEQDERYGSSSLLLEGTYEPPFGVAGLAFDAAFGRRIASATAHELLHVLRCKIEDSWSAANAKTGSVANGG